MESQGKLFRIAELERLSGFPRHTIHKYVRDGLLPAPVKTGKTMAYYDLSHLERLQAIREIKGTSRLPVSYLKKVLEDRGESIGDSALEDEAGKRGESRTGAREKRKQQIKDAAFEVFLEKGFQQARIQDITTAAGISTGTFYIYYGDKRELFMDVIDELIQNTMTAIEDAIARDGDSLGRVTAAARLYMEDYDYFSGIINQLRGMMAATEPSAREKFKALHNQLADPIVRGIRTAIEQGLIREVDPELLARALMGIVEFLAIYLSFDDKHDSAEATSFMVDLIMNGVGRE
jgi:AcrR family transcriptional regulator/predicted DNA-binding transcriptional regulator AlpA